MENQDMNALNQTGLKNKTIGDWLVTFLLSAIPLVGFILLIVWANDKEDLIRKTWAGAMLVMIGIVFVLYLFIFMIIGAAGGF